MITRRRYNITIKKSQSKAQQSAHNQDARISGTRGVATPMIVPEPAAQVYWWHNWKSLTVVIGLSVSVGFGLFFLKGKEYSRDGSASASTATATASPSSPAPGNSPARRSGGSRSPTGSLDPQTGSAESFLAFAHEQRAASGAAAPSSGSRRTASTAVDSSSPLFEDDRKVALPENVSGECDVGGGNGFLGGLSDCFKRHGARPTK